MSKVKQRMSADHFIGQQIREARRNLKLTQEQVGTAMGLTFQQIQKFERGINRVSAGQLLEFSKLLKQPLEFFFPVAIKNEQAPVCTIAELQVAELRKSIKESVNKISDIDCLRAIAHLANVAAA